jgi:hypothetical protein
MSGKNDESARATIGRNLDDLRSKLAKIEAKSAKFKISLEKGINEIQEHCIGLRTKVHLQTDILLEQIHEYNEQFVAEIDQYEAKCIESYETNISKRKAEFDVLLPNRPSFILIS